MKQDEIEFAQMVRAHKETIYTVCYMFAKDADEVNDLFQEVLINLWSGLAYDIYCNQLLSTQNYSNGNLIDEARKLSRYKQLSRQWHWFSIPFLCIWLPWFVYEATTAAGFFAKIVLIGGLIGGVIGGTIGLTIYRKGQNAVSEVIEQIEELTGEKESH